MLRKSNLTFLVMCMICKDASIAELDIDIPNC